MLTPLRLATVHPALAHFTIGGLPLIVIAYVLAWRRRSASWAFVGDAALIFTGAVTLFTCTFGLVSNAVVPWPGGIETWRWLHLAGGVATTVLLALVAALRLHARQRKQASLGLLAGVLTIAGLGMATGWTGGEVLVFHAGMAVRAAGDGALAPTVSPARAEPSDFLDAMRQARAAWGTITARLSWMLVQHPRDEDFALIEREARRLEQLAGFMGAHPPAKVRDADALTSMSQVFAGDADDLAQAAQAHDLQGLAKALGETGGHCADCHEQQRWPGREGRATAAPSP